MESQRKTKRGDGMLSLKIKLSRVTYKVVKELMTISKSGKIKFY
jgi:hypothetical protein